MMKLFITVWNTPMLIDKLEVRDSFKIGRDTYTILAFRDDYVYTVNKDDAFKAFPYGIDVKRAKFVSKKRRNR